MEMKNRMPSLQLLTLGALCCAGLAGTGAQRVAACPFCNATSQTLSEELQSAEASVIATLEQPVSDSSLDDPSADTPLGDSSEAVFRVQKVLRGENHVHAGDTIHVVYFGADAPDKLFLINALMVDQLDWTTPLPLSRSGVEYVEHLLKLPDVMQERLRFFLQYMEHPDPLLAQDAYDEFARAPYADLVNLKPDLNREQLVAWINDPQVGPTRRRLYLTMLGVCGTSADVEMLESLLKYDYETMRPAIATLVQMMGFGGSAVGVPLVDELAQADVRAKQQCLDALIAAYLKLRGPDGLPLIDERFLSNPQADYTQRYSAIMALRFHGEESDEIPRERLVKSLRLLLDDPEIADQVIPDLTRWEDWEVMDRLVDMFKKSDQDGWIRQPVISYLLIAADQPGDVGEKANKWVAELEELDPEAVKRARSYLSFGIMARSGGTTTSQPGEGATVADESATEVAAADEEATPGPGQAPESEPKASAEEPAADETTAQETPADEVETAATESAPPSQTTIVLVSAVVGLLLMGLFGVILRGGHISQ